MSDDEGKPKEKVSVDTGLKVALKSMGHGDVPSEVSAEEYENLSSQVSQGVRLRMEAKAREQNKVMMWKSRVNLLKQAKSYMGQKAFSEAAVAYEKYLRILEIVYELKPGELAPDIFNKSKRSKELTVVTSVYWDLVRIYDSSKTYGDRQQNAARKLALFLPYSTIFPMVVKRAQMFQRKAKNPAIIKRLLKEVNAGKSGCFIATATYENPFAPEVVFFREYRDNILQKSRSGRLFVKLYYAASPRISAFIYSFPITKKPIRKVLNQIFAILKNRA